MSAEKHAIHLLEKKLDAQCRECLLIRIRSTRADWRVKAHSGGYAVSDSQLAKQILREWLDLKDIKLNDTDEGFRTAFEVLGVPVRRTEVEEINLMPCESLSGTPAKPYVAGAVELDEFTKKISNTKVERTADPGKKPVRKSILGRLRQLARRRAARSTDRLNEAD